MHRLISAAIVAICAVAIGTPALAASHMGAAAPIHIGSAHPFAAPHMGVHQMSMAARIDRAHHDRGDGHRHGGRNRNGFPLEPFGYFDSGFDSGVGPDEIAAPPAEPFIDPPPFVPPIPAAELPPCRETGAGGVVVLRGTGCAR